MFQRLTRGISSFEAHSKSLVVIGNFDGVHRGHQQVLETACSLAKHDGLVPVVLTFDPHPAEVLGRAKLERLTTLERKVELLLRLDPALSVVVEPFSAELAVLTPEAFAAEVLVKGLSARRVLVGENFRFGHKRAGDLARLVALGRELGFEATALELVGDGAGAYSSTRVREALAQGDLGLATSILGRPHALTGLVVHGDQRGRTLGFPTANLSQVVEQLPKLGVYAAAVDVEHAGAFRRLGLGALNIGVRPTVQAGPSIEVHVLDFSDDLYGQRLRVHLIEYLRGEERFSGLDALKEQLGRDTARVRSRLEQLAPAPDAKEAWF